MMMELLYLYLSEDEACPVLDAVLPKLGPVSFSKAEITCPEEAAAVCLTHSPTLRVNGREANLAAEDLLQEILRAAAAPLPAEEDWFLPDSLIEYFGTKMKNCPGRTCPCELCE